MTLSLYKKKKSLVSVIMPYYNKKDYFSDSFKSAINQTYKNLEIIIIYDQRNLDDFFYIKEIISKNKNVRVFFNKKNRGVSFSRNLGIKKSKGEYIAFLDCDDIWSEKKLSVQISYMKNNFVDFLHTSYYIINSKNTIIGKRFAKSEITYNQLINSCDIGLSSVVVKKNILERYKKPFSPISTKEDYLLWLRISKKNKIIGLNKFLVYWRKSKGSLSSFFLIKFTNAFHIYYKYEGFSFLHSLFRVLVLSFNYLRKLKT
jgi:teichuronic acid biosynthesis glycosyltransferase TuaG